MSESNKAVLRKANAAISKGDIEGFLVHCTENTEWIFVGDRTLSGKDAVRQWMKETYTVPPAFEVERLISDDDSVIAVGEITVVDSSGKSTRSWYCDVWRLDNGLLAQLKAFVVEKRASDG